MNRALLAAKSRKLAAALAESYGVRVLFRGEELQLAIAPATPTMTLGAGGFRDSASWRIRVPATVQPPPGFNADQKRIKESFVEIGTGRTFHVVSCVPAAPDAALAQEHIVEAELA